MQRITKFIWALISAHILVFATTAMTTPLKISTSLPLTGTDISRALTQLKTHDDAEGFTQFIKGLDVFPDHKNPTAINLVDNRSLKKAFYLTPYFQAAEERPYVGSQEIASEGIRIIAEAYDLISAFDFELLKLTQYAQEKGRKTLALADARKKLVKETDSLTRQTLQGLVTQMENELKNINFTIATLEQQASQGLNEASLAIKQQVVSQIELRLSFLGVTATNEESQLLQSTDGTNLRRGLAKLIARATKDGQFGYRNAIYEAGLTKQQSEWLMLYRALRPDVTVSTIATSAVYARSTALSAKGDQESGDKYFLGKDQIVGGPRIFLAVNGGSNGACGNTKSCNVILEYTWLGATMAKSSRTGAVAMPIYFEADIAVMQPDFEGSVQCNFTNGFSSKGRADVRDGAVIYDGDVTNRINYSALEDGSCNYTIIKGDADGAAYHTIKALFDNYIALKMQRAVKSRDEQDSYKQSITRELAYHANQSQNTNLEFWSLGTWTAALGAPWGTVASFVVGAARSFYWHTRIEDSTTKETVRFTTAINESKVQKRERIAFDAFTLLCWKKDGVDSFLSACPSANLQEYKNNADTDLGKTQQLCSDDGTSADCLKRAEENERDSITDDYGVVENPIT